ncbi:MAG: hypothetical protein SGJ04_09870 [Bacteroidota bacterium]|nr:hypothetical protein [Bacteroidota bacterium]
MKALSKILLLLALVTLVGSCGKEDGPVKFGTYTYSFQMLKSYNGKPAVDVKVNFVGEADTAINDKNRTARFTRQLAATAKCIDLGQG